MEKVIINGYTVFENGTVLGKRGNKLTWHENGRGYLITKLNWDGKWQTKALHTVVCEAFHGKRPEGCEAAHLDGVSTNNFKDNLKWLTKSENRKQMYQDGRNVSGTRNANNKYTTDQIKGVCDYLELRCSVSWIAKKTGVSRGTVNAIKHRRQWHYISDNYSFWIQGSTTRT